MTPENFVYWLQGMMEIGNPKTLDEEQVTTIKDHIALVLTKVTPDRKIKAYEFHPWVSTTTSMGTPSPVKYYQMPAYTGIEDVMKNDIESPSINYTIEGSC